MLSNWLSTEVMVGLLRNVLLSGAVSTMAGGYVSHEQWVTIVGAIITIASVAMSAWSNRGKAQAVAVVKAVEAHPGVSVVPVAGKPVVVLHTPTGNNRSIGEEEHW